MSFCAEVCKTLTESDLGAHVLRISRDFLRTAALA
jgi:hypothetical protein